jgi:hypothetical protein
LKSAAFTVEDAQGSGWEIVSAGSSYVGRKLLGTRRIYESARRVEDLLPAIQARERTLALEPKRKGSLNGSSHH